MARIQLSLHIYFGEQAGPVIRAKKCRLYIKRTNVKKPDSIAGVNTSTASRRKTHPYLARAPLKECDDALERAE